MQGTRKSRKPYVPHPFSERVRVVGLYKEGLGSKRIAKELGLDDSMVRAWLRRYRSEGIDALRPYSRGKEVPADRQYIRRSENELILFEPACEVFATTLEPVASIARRYRLNYSSFKYHVERYRPDLVRQRKALREKTVTETTN